MATGDLLIRETHDSVRSAAGATFNRMWELARMESSQKARPRSGRGRQIISGIIALGVVVLVFAVLLPQFADYGDAWETVKHLSVVAIAALSITTLFNIIVYVWPFQAALPGLSLGNAFVVRHTSFMVSNVVPAGGAVGLGLQYSMLSGFGVPASQAAAAIGITATWNILVTVLLPVIAVVISLLTGGASPSKLAIAAAVVVLSAVIVYLLIVAFRSDTVARRIGDLAAIPVQAVFRLAGSDRTLALADSLSDFRASTVEVVRARWARVTLTNLLMQLAQFAILFVAISAIQTGSTHQVTLAETFVAFGLARLASFVPITPGGLGTVDAALVAILVSFGASNPDSVASVLLWRGLSYFPQVILGVVTLLVWRKTQPARVAKPVASNPV